MRVLYLSCHEVLEWDELCMFTEMQVDGHPLEVFSMGAFTNPTQSGGYMRTVIPHGKYYPDLFGIAMQSDKDNIHPELLQWADVVIMMHNSAIPSQKEQQRWLVRNWQKFTENNCKVIWRSIGQSTPAIETELQGYKKYGLNIVRYSPLEEKLPHYAGQDTLIRFAKDSEEFDNWVGTKKQVITIAQSYKKRGDHLGFPIFEKITDGFSRRVYGTENADLGEMNGGSPTYGELKQILREARVFFYFGTIPAPYTLSIMEAMMTGIPVVAVGKKLRSHNAYGWENYEIPDIIVNGVNGFCSDNVEELKQHIKNLMEDDELAQRISIAGRKTAIELWDKTQRMAEWSDFLRRL